ncbi:DgyrCDS13399 [Dimorphilus gyrociliatus]|uniref:DgyrCDS13399 n=1 Tax=Dimorphilus gyrociliatus TaxID=2664684 RepID=A0A7I8WAN0_9ANNE|nr:DgyrCDS13399 [Dimorphilus gyrociliatus]
MTKERSGLMFIDNTFEAQKHEKEQEKLKDPVKQKISGNEKHCPKTDKAQSKKATKQAKTTVAHPVKDGECQTNILELTETATQTEMVVSNSDKTKDEEYTETKNDDIEVMQEWIKTVKEATSEENDDMQKEREEILKENKTLREKIEELEKKVENLTEVAQYFEDKAETFAQYIEKNLSNEEESQ